MTVTELRTLLEEIESRGAGDFNIIPSNGNLHFKGLLPGVIADNKVYRRIYGKTIYLDIQPW